MSKKIVFRTFIAIIGICTIALLLVQIRAEKEVGKFLSMKIPSHIRLDYETISANIFTGSVHIEEIGVAISNRNDTTIHTRVKADYLKIVGLDYWPFLFNKTFHVNNLIIGRPIIKYFLDKKSKRVEKDTLGVVKLLKTIIVDQVEIENGSFFILKNESDSLLLESHQINFTLNGFKTDPNIIKRKIPLNHEDYTFSASNSFVDLNPFETLNIKKINVQNKNVVINDIRVTSKYEKENSSKYLERERDHVTLEIPKLDIGSLDFGFGKDKFYLFSDEIELTRPRLEVFRDKSLADDTAIKNMYSKHIRNLPIDIKVSKFKLTEAHLGYEERLRGHELPGRLFIDNINANILGLDTNAVKGDTTRLSAKGMLMGNAPINIDYMFDLTNENDEFLVMGKVISLRAAELNSFLKPNLNVETEGDIDEMYFTISGDSFASRGEMKMRYSDFSFDILRKDGKRVDKILTTIGNLFINDGKDKSDAGFRFGQIKAERNSDKSFFNYLWLGIKSGIVSTLTGDGKKKK
ncbi:hypothetical protein OO010_08840 [Flavobacteriaceae bacterium KMM 6898]|nr:hypothetical protein [Flavobacteriaceae bacterium KMM 6898]